MSENIAVSYSRHGGPDQDAQNQARRRLSLDHNQRLHARDESRGLIIGPSRRFIPDPVLAIVVDSESPHYLARPCISLTNPSNKVTDHQEKSLTAEARGQIVQAMAADPAKFLEAHVIMVTNKPSHRVQVLDLSIPPAKRLKDLIFPQGIEPGRLRAYNEYVNEGPKKLARQYLFNDMFTPFESFSERERETLLERLSTLMRQAEEKGVKHEMVDNPYEPYMTMVNDQVEVSALPAQDRPWTLKRPLPSAQPDGEQFEAHGRSERLEIAQAVGIGDYQVALTTDDRVRVIVKGDPDLNRWYTDQAETDTGLRLTSQQYAVPANVHMVRGTIAVLQAALNYPDPFAGAIGGLYPPA